MPPARANRMSRLRPSSATEEELPWSRLGRADSRSVGARSEVTPAGTSSATAPRPNRPPRPVASNPGGTGVSPGKYSGSGGFSAVVSASLSGRVGAGWVVRPERPDEELPPEPPSSPPGFAASAMSLVATAPAGEGAGAVVTVELDAVVVVDDGRLVVVDRPVPPEDGMDVLVVEGPGLGVEVEVVVVSASSSAGTVVVVVEGSEVVVVVV